MLYSHIYMWSPAYSQVLPVDEPRIAFIKGYHVGMHWAGSSSIETIDIVLAHTPFTITSW